MFLWAVKLLGINSIPSEIHSGIPFRFCYDPFGPQCSAVTLWSTLSDTSSIASFHSSQLEYEPVSSPWEPQGFSTCPFLVFLIQQFPHIHANICTQLKPHQRVSLVLLLVSRAPWRKPVQLPSLCFIHLSVLAVPQLTFGSLSS